MQWVLSGPCPACSTTEQAQFSVLAGILASDQHGVTPERAALCICSTPAEAAPTGDILDYLKGRGGKVRALPAATLRHCALCHQSLNVTLLPLMLLSDQGAGGASGRAAQPE